MRLLGHFLLLCRLLSGLALTHRVRICPPVEIRGNLSPTVELDRRDPEMV